MFGSIWCRLPWIGVLALAFLAAGGCSTVDQIHTNMSPELDTYAQNHGQSRNDLARGIDHSTRAIWDDWNRLWLVDRGSRLHPYPAP